MVADDRDRTDLGAIEKRLADQSHPFNGENVRNATSDSCRWKLCPVFAIHAQGGAVALRIIGAIIRGLRHRSGRSAYSRRIQMDRRPRQNRRGLSLKGRHSP